MRKTVLILCGLAFLAPVKLTAAVTEKPPMTDQDVPGLIKAGIRAYRDTGASPAMSAWTRNGPLDGSKAALDETSILTQANQTLGRFESYDVAGGSDLTPHTRILYLVLNYERGPLFARLVVYRANQDWVLTDIDLSFHDDRLFLPLLQ